MPNCIVKVPRLKAESKVMVIVCGLEPDDCHCDVPLSRSRATVEWREWEDASNPAKPLGLDHPMALAVVCKVGGGGGKWERGRGRVRI